MHRHRRLQLWPFEGATRAVDEFVRGRRMRQFYKVLLGSCYLVK